MDTPGCQHTKSLRTTRGGGPGATQAMALVKRLAGGVDLALGCSIVYIHSKRDRAHGLRSKVMLRPFTFSPCTIRKLNSENSTHQLCITLFTMDFVSVCHIGPRAGEWVGVQWTTCSVMEDLLSTQWKFSSAADRLSFAHSYIRTRPRLTCLPPCSRTLPDHSFHHTKFLWPLHLDFRLRASTQ